MVAKKLKDIFDAWQPDNVGYMYTTFAQANVAFDDFDRIAGVESNKPCIVVEAPTLGSLVPYDRQFSDYPRFRIWALEPMGNWDQDRDLSEVQIDDMKKLLCRFLIKIQQSHQFYPLADKVELPYLVNLGLFNRALCGVGVDVVLKERRPSFNLCDDNDL